MNQQEAQQKFEELGKKWLEGGRLTSWQCPSGEKIILSENQVRFISSKKRYVLCSGGYASGKSFALNMLLIFNCLFFPNSAVLLGRKTLMDIDRTSLPELFTLLNKFIPTDWYRHRIKEGVINFWNGSKIILMGLDALQGEGSSADIKKARQRIKSLNLSGIFLEQIEEIDYEVFEALGARLRKADVPIRIFRATCNPANFWAYNFFKINPQKRDDVELIETSMMENSLHLPKDYLDDQLSKDRDYVERFVFGKWDINLLLKGTVFSTEHILRLERMTRPPIAIEEGFEIFEQPKSTGEYFIGIDPSEGIEDFCAISVVAPDGRKVAKLHQRLTIPVLIDKVHWIYSKYHTDRSPLIILEVNASGLAVLEGTKNLRHYERKVYDHREKRETLKLGWKTSWETKRLLITHFQDLLRQKDFFPEIYDKNTVEEMKVFCWNDSARQVGAGASRGFYDDDLIATLLSFIGIRGRPQLSPEDIRRLRETRDERIASRIRKVQFPRWKEYQ